MGRTRSDERGFAYLLYLPVSDWGLFSACSDSTRSRWEGITDTFANNRDLEKEEVANNSDEG